MLKGDNVSVEINSKLMFHDVTFEWSNLKSPIIKNCNFSINHPGFWMIIGRNGCGKSTLFKLAQGIIGPTKGYIEKPSIISMVFQNPDHQILMPTCGSELILNIKAKLSRKETQEKVYQSLAAVGLEEFYERPIHTLSGGQKQRLAIASALISESKFVLMDEPTALLDEYSQKNVLEIVKRLTISDDNPLTVIWITHRMKELEYADKVAEMNNGKLSEWQNPSNFMNI